MNNLQVKLLIFDGILATCSLCYILLGRYFSRQELLGKFLYLQGQFNNEILTSDPVPCTSLINMEEDNIETSINILLFLIILASCSIHKYRSR